RFARGIPARRVLPALTLDVAGVARRGSVGGLPDYRRRNEQLLRDGSLRVPDSELRRNVVRRPSLPPLAHLVLAHPDAACGAYGRQLADRIRDLEWQFLRTAGLLPDSKLERIRRWVHEIFPALPGDDLHVRRCRCDRTRSCARGSFALRRRA